MTDNDVGHGGRQAARRLRPRALQAPAPGVDDIGVDVDVVGRLRRVVSGTAWFEQARQVAEAVWDNSVLTDGLVIAGVPPYVPAHLIEHLDEAAHAVARPGLSPRPAAGRQDGWEDVATAGGGQSVLVVSPGAVPTDLAQALAMARAREACVVSIDTGDPALALLCDARLVIGRPSPRPSQTQIAAARASGIPLPDVHPVDALPLDVAEHLLASMLLHHGDRSVPWPHRVGRQLRRRVVSVWPVGV